MKQARWVDQSGRIWVTLIPDEAMQHDARIGIPVGPPNLRALFPVSSSGFADAVSVRIHNALVEREILTYADAKKRLPEIVAAIQSALKLDAMAILGAYKEHQEKIDKLDNVDVDSVASAQ